MGSSRKVCCGLSLPCAPLVVPAPHTPPGPSAVHPVSIPASTAENHTVLLCHRAGSLPHRPTRGARGRRGRHAYVKAGGPVVYHLEKRFSVIWASREYQPRTSALANLLDAASKVNVNLPDLLISRAAMVQGCWSVGFGVQKECFLFDLQLVPVGWRDRAAGTEPVIHDPERG